MSKTATAIHAYVGSFTTEARRARGDGINVFRVDADGGWTHLQRVGDLVNPSFLALDHQERRLYSVHADLAYVSAFARDPETGMLRFLNRQEIGGRNPVHLALDPSGRFLVTGNYAAGTVTSLPIAADGSLGALRDTLTLPGEPGPHRTQQTSSHPHHDPFDPAGRFIFVPDKGLDRIFVLRLDAESGKLAFNDPPYVASRAGAAPRHIAFHPRLPVAYCVNELDSTVTTYAYDAARGRLAPRDILPTTPPTYTGDNTGSEIAVHPAGRFVYVSNRGHDSIAIYAADPADGTLAAVGWEPTQGRTPRFFALDPAGIFLYAANEASDSVVAFRVEPSSGRLAATGRVIANKSPACIVFAGAPHMAR